jgi:hypothetical protein
LTRPVRKPTIKTLNIRRSEHRAIHEQQRAIADELHAIVTRVTGAWTYIQKQAADYGRGYRATTLGSGIACGSTDTLVERHALDPTAGDPGHTAERILAGWMHLISEARRIDDQLTKLIPMTDTEQDEHRGRQSTIEVCVGCDEPIADGAIKRIDGEPYHKNTCYYREWRKRRDISA